MRFSAFTEIQLNLGMRDIQEIGDCQWATPTHPTAITATIPPLPRGSPKPSISVVPGSNRNSAVEFCNRTVYPDMDSDKIYRVGLVMISNLEPNRQLVTS